MNKPAAPVIELKCTPWKEYDGSQVTLSGSKDAARHDACAAHALKQAIKEMRESGMPRIQSVYRICADIEATAASILKQDFGIEASHE